MVGVWPSLDIENYQSISRRYMSVILPIRRKTLYNQSINKTFIDAILETCLQRIDLASLIQSMILIVTHLLTLEQSWNRRKLKRQYSDSTWLEKMGEGRSSLSKLNASVEA